MADRVTKVSLTAQVSNYVTGMDQAAKATVGAANASQAASARFAAQNQAMTQIGTGLVAIGAIAAVGIGLAVKKFADFDQAMSFVAAATHESADNMTLLRDAALDAGARTVFTATEAANAIEELGKAGLTTADILGGGLDGALSLAAAGGLGVAEAAGIAAIALKTFKLEGSDMTHVADLLAAGAGKAMGDVTDLAAALAQSGQVAASTGLSIEETTATLSAFAAQGLLGSDAGTSFKSMLQRLTPVSAESKREMDRLGISAYDVNGNFIGMEKFAGNLQESLKDLTTEQRNAALAQIFGSDAVRAATVLYSEGAKGIADWTSKVDDTGYAAATAAMRLDNLKGDVEKLGGAFDTALIKSGSSANDVLRGFVQSATFLVDGFGSLPAPVLAAGVAVLAVAGSVALVGGGALIAIPKVVAFKGALDTLGVSARMAGLGIGLAGGAIALATIGISMWIEGQAKAAAAADALASTLDKQTGRFTASTREMVKSNLAVKQSWMFLEGDSAFDSAEKLGLSLDLVTEASMGNVEAMRKLQKELEVGTLGSDKFNAAQERTGLVGTELTTAITNVTNGIKGQSGSLEEAIRVTEQKNKVTETGTGITSESAAAYKRAGEEADTLTGNIKDLITEIDKANGVNQDAVTSNANFRGALEGITAEIQTQKDEFEKANGSLDGFTASLDESTGIGSSNAAMLSDLASKAQGAAAAQYQVDLKTMSAKDATEKYVETLARSKQAIIDQATENGLGGEALQRLIDKVYSVPDQKTTKMLIDTATATQQINDWVSIINGKRINIAVGIGGAGGITRAEGGILPGAPSSKDNMFIHAASGEFITNARSTAVPANRRALEYMNNGGSIQGYANGGAVGYAPPQYASQSRYPTSSGSNNRGDVNTEININEVTDPIGTANAVVRRLASLGA